ncbi:MAG: DUF58 domain-containing protein [Planctomycetes bacterium]|nr:DUF58 domain-containing protein [Planctomycetota bacterium]
MIDRELLAQVRRIQVRTNRMVTDVMAGGYTSVFRGSGIEFDEVREFVDGDDFRAVDWNVTARTGRPHIKKYMEERELTVLFLLDVSASTAFGTVERVGKDHPRSVRETAAEFCACLSLAAARNNDKVGMITFTDQVETYIPAKKGSQHVLRLIREALAAEGRGQQTNLAAALDYAARVQRKRAVVFVVSDFLDDGGYSRALKLLGRRHDVVAVRLLDPHSRELPDAGLLYLRDLESGAARWVDSSSRGVRRAYADRVRAHDEAFVRELRKARVDLLEIRPERSIAEPIMKFFRMRELRGAHG